ncbi:MAG: hypothetical protein COB67_09630 [SAR324 cluster bacterium]|uniref:RHS repeat-associated core domain-containing protein n=1 Tax=SAR324 cluster bacterium TaxID=2024889 RepID=A0A2A4T0V1_9DELT|nr:MAG: hypothetical protein COB67_09630 [SAR324 cluster bacterium]
MTYSGGFTTAYQYDNEGNVIQKTDANGIATNVVYDNNYRITNLNYSNGESEVFTYDDAGALLNMVNSNGATAFIRDILGRTISTTDPFGNSVHYGYDQIGNNTHIVYPSGDTVSMTYNAVGLQTQTRDWLGNYTNRTYDANGQLSSILNSNGTSTSITRDALGRITAYDNYLGTGARFYSDSLFYDASGNIINIISDDLLQPNFVTSTHSYSHGSDDRITNSPLGIHTHDAKGAISSTSGTTNRSFTFGENDVLKQYTLNGQTTQIVSNPLNQAISKTRNGNETQYAYSNIESDLYTAIQEFDASNNTRKSNIYAADGLGWSLDSAGNVSFLTYNYLGHTKALTNTTGDTTDIYAYGPFGDFFAHRGTNSQQHTFLGKYGIYHEDNDFFHIRARHYDAGNGRFVSKDKAALENGSTQGVNRYVYTANKPFGAVDVNGYNDEVLHCPSNPPVVEQLLPLSEEDYNRSVRQYHFSKALALADRASGEVLTEINNMRGVSSPSLELGKASLTESTLQKADVISLFSPGKVLKAPKAYKWIKKSLKVNKLFSYFRKIEKKIPRTNPKNLKEKLAMEEIMSNPNKGSMEIIKKLNDKNWKEWVKMSNKTDHGIEIHFNAIIKNGIIIKADNFKFINP